MRVILTDYDRDYPFNGAAAPRRLVIAGKGKPDSLRGELVKLSGVAAKKRRPPANTTISDVQGSPSESRCSEALLENIRAARDEEEAAKLKAVPR